MVRTHQNCYFFGRNSGMGSLDHSIVVNIILYDYTHQ